MIADDAALAITWQELADRLQRWEELLLKHPALAPELQPEIHFMAYIFFIGLDNTPIRTDDEHLNSEVLAAWRLFAEKAPQSQYAFLIRMLIPALEKDGLKWTATETATVAGVDQQRRADVRDAAAKR